MIAGHVWRFLPRLHAIRCIPPACRWPVLAHSIDVRALALQFDSPPVANQFNGCAHACGLRDPNTRRPE
eukprot:4787234-Alexandrium_andersonii.AAC.1